MSLLKPMKLAVWRYPTRCLKFGMGKLRESMVELLNESLPSQATINVIPGCTKAEERIRIKACLVSKKGE